MDNTKNSHKFKLRRYHYLAIELRYQGKTYRQISEDLGSIFKVNFRPDRIGHWFARRGVLEAAYIDYADKENERRRRHLAEELNRLLDRIPKVLEKLLDRKDQTGQPDSTTLGAVRLLVDLLDIKTSMREERSPVDDRLDAYFARLEKFNCHDKP